MKGSPISRPGALRPSGPTRARFLLLASLVLAVLVVLPGAISNRGVATSSPATVLRPFPETETGSAESASARPATEAVNASPAFPTSIRHVIMILEENQEWSEVWKYGPYQVSLARAYANVSQFYALHQTSWSAYIAATSGYNTARPPFPLDVYSIANLTTNASETWGEWVENAPGNCNRTADPAIGYTTRHTPFLWYNRTYDDKSVCDQDVVSKTLSQMTSALSSGTNIPNFLLITPDQFDDGDAYHAACAPGVTNHTQAEEVCTDEWLQALLPSLIHNSALFNQTAVLISYDQTSTSDDNGSIVGADGGHVYTVVVSPEVIPHYNDTTPYTAFNLLTTTEWLLGLPGGTLLNDDWSTRAPMRELFRSASDVTFTQSGLPAGTPWSVTLNGGEQTSNGTSLVFSEKNGHYSFSVEPVPGYTAAPARGTVDVDGQPVTQPITFTPIPPTTYEVTFSETGLPSGTNWSVQLNGTTGDSSGPAITFEEPNGTYPFDSQPVPGYEASPSSGNVTVVGAPVRQSIRFVAITTTYAVTFDESGAPAGTSWYLNVTGEPSVRSDSTTATVSLPNGTYSFSIASSNKDYSPSPADGNFTVAGEPLARSASFVPVLYLVSFTETGWSGDTNWSVTLNGTTERSTTSEIEFSERNGTYVYSVGAAPGFARSPTSGTVAVNGSGAGVGITFTAVTTTWPVAFTENGLPFGVEWWVALNGTKEESTNLTIAFLERNGTYPYAVGTTNDFAASPGSGMILMNGSEVDRAVSFTPPPTMYTVTFTESGLPSGTSWTVSLNGTPFSLTSRAATFSEPNGTYPFTVSVIANYTASPSAGSVTVNGDDIGQAITFTLVPPAPNNQTGTPTFLGMPALDGYVLVGEIAAAVVVGSAGIILLPRWGRRPPGPLTPAPGAAAVRPPPP